MTTIDDPGVRPLLERPNHAVVSTLNADGSVHSAVVWVDVEDGRLALNSAVGRAWPANLARDPRITVVVYDEDNPYDYVEVQGTASSSTEGAHGHIDRLAKKYLDVDRYPAYREGEQRISFFVDAARVRHTKLR